MNVLSVVESFLSSLEHVVSLEMFVFVGSFIEEVVSPIPSMVIMGSAGSIANASGHAVGYLFVLSALGNIGKLLGASFYYVLGDRLENIVVRRFGRFFGVTHEQVEGLGQRFTGHWKDGLTLFLLRLTPFVPTTPVSISCGVIRMNIRTFASASFFGNFIKDFFYLLIGFMGIEVFRSFFRDMLAIKQYVDIAIFSGFVVLLILLWYHRKKGYWVWELVKKKLKIKGIFVVK